MSTATGVPSSRRGSSERTTATLLHRASGTALAVNVRLRPGGSRRASMVLSFWQPRHAPVAWFAAVQGADSTSAGASPSRPRSPPAAGGMPETRLPIVVLHRQVPRTQPACTEASHPRDEHG